jgi:hypothetical protein
MNHRLRGFVRFWGNFLSTSRHAWNVKKDDGHLLAEAVYILQAKRLIRGIEHLKSKVGFGQTEECESSSSISDYGV